MREIGTVDDHHDIRAGGQRRIDATFGPETRAAIRRYQFEIKADMTGTLTAEQATKLVNSVR